MQDGETVHFDIFAFDSDQYGGMDELKIEFAKAPETTAQVTVKYWLNNMLGDPLDSGVISAVDIGSTIKLNPGTSVNELNYAKAKAITKAQTDVSDGVPDYGENGYTVVEGENVINVIYKEKDLKQAAFTYDFGVTNQYTYAAGGHDLSKAEFAGNVPAGFGDLSLDSAGGTVNFTYTPQDALGKPVNATLRLTRGTGDQAASFNVQLYVIPASNVLYEENFILDENAQGWNITGHDAVTVSDNGNNVYGHTSAYENVVGENGAWSTSMTADAVNSKDMTFNFSGTGLDVLGTCGPETGKLAIKVENARNGDYVVAYVVDTFYSVEDLYQVPLIHAMNLESGIEYRVTVRGIYAERAAAAAAYANGMGGPVIDPVVYSTLVDMGLTDEQIIDVEFINMQNELGAGTMALTASADAPAAVADSPASERVSVDSFRVYHSTDNEGYAENEQNLVYTNVMDEAITGSFYAYVEGDGQGSFTTIDYERLGGPENELYLRPGDGVVFGTDGSYAQVSLHAVNQPTSWNGHAISHNTEMYYEVDPADNMIVITNTGDALLALGNLKTNGTVTTIADRPAAVRMVASFFAMPEPEPEPEPKPEPETEPETQPEPAPEFLVFFELNKWGYSWDDGTPRHQIKQFTVSEEDGGIMAPAMDPGEGFRLVCWKAVDQDLTLSEREILTAQAMEDCADWSGKERIVIFRPVIEEIRTAFEPEHFDVRLSVEKGYTAQYVTVSAEASAEVAYITVNGQRVDARNADWVEFGFDPYLLFDIELELGRNDEVNVEVVAYDCDGNASEVFLAK